MIGEKMIKSQIFILSKEIGRTLISWHDVLTHTPVSQLMVSTLVWLGHAAPPQLGFRVIFNVRVLFEIPQPLHGPHGFQLQAQLTGQHCLLQLWVALKAWLQEPPHIACTEIPLVRYCVPVPHGLVHVLQLLQRPGVQSRLHRLRRRLRHASTEERKKAVKSRATKIAATFILGVRWYRKWNFRCSNVLYSMQTCYIRVDSL